MPKTTDTFSVLDNITRACEIIEIGDQRLLHKGEPCGNVPPDLSLIEWRQIYECLDQARKKLTSPDKVPNCTPCQLEILKLVAKGKSSKEIAKLIFRSVKTVEKHRSTAGNNMNLHSIWAITVFCLQNNLVQLSDLIPTGRYGDPDEQ